LRVLDARRAVRAVRPTLRPPLRDLRVCERAILYLRIRFFAGSLGTRLFPPEREETDEPRLEDMFGATVRPLNDACGAERLRVELRLRGAFL
jgi:hypothetical protein